MTDERSAETAAELDAKNNLITDLSTSAHDWREEAFALRTQLDEARTYAENLAVALSRHYPHVPQWKPLTGDLIGLLTQIDNMTACLVPASPSPVLRDAVMVPRDIVDFAGEMLGEASDRLGLDDMRTISRKLLALASLATTGDRT